MTIAAASESQIALIAEATYGVIQPTPVWQRMRMTSDDLKGTPIMIQSDEIRPDAEVSDLIKVGENIDGGIGFELSYGPEFDTVLEHALRNDFVSNASIDTGVTAMSVGATNTFDRAAGSFVTDGFLTGQYVTTTGFTDGANNGTFLVVAVAALVLTVASTSLVIEGAGVDEQIVAQGSELRGGTDKTKSFAFERLLETGATDQYQRFKGCRINTFSLNTVAEQIVTGGYTVLGIEEDDMDTAIVAGATYTDANTNPVMSAIDVGSIKVGNTTGVICYESINFTLNNNCSRQPIIGSVNAKGINYNRRVITGSLKAYFEDADLYEEAKNNSEVGIFWDFTDGTNRYTIGLPRVKFSSRANVVSGNDQDVFVEADFQALLDSTNGASIQIQN